ncbi:MAG: hypothetical protein AABX51_02895 [Nanoarchaeota archaeon]
MTKRLESKISLEILLGQIDESLPQKIRDRQSTEYDPIVLLRTVYDHYLMKFDDEGPQALAHGGWALIELGNYFDDIGKRNMAIQAYRQAYYSFTDPECRGHEETGNQLLQQVPELVLFLRRDERYDNETKPINPN